MDSGDKLVALAFSLIGTVVLSIVVGVSSVNITDTRAIVKLVLDGADPIAARCSVKGDGYSPMCAVYAAKR